MFTKTGLNMTTHFFQNEFFTSQIYITKLQMLVKLTNHQFKLFI